MVADPPLTLTLDYYRIKISNAIQSVAGSTKLATCYNTPGRAHIFCNASSFTRNPATGEIDFLSSQPVNAADERISGIDLGVLYDFSVAGWNASLSTELSHLKNYEVRPLPGRSRHRLHGQDHRRPWQLYPVALTEHADDGQGPMVGFVHGPVHRFRRRHQCGTDGHRCARPRHHLSLGQAKYAVNKAFDIALGIDNLFDKKPPFIKSYTDANTDTMTYDLLGRRWHVRAGYRW